MATQNYTTLEEKFWEVFQILGAYFNQDVHSFQEGANEYLKNNASTLQSGLNKLKEFLNSNELSVNEKKEFIESKVELSFSFYKLDPLDWLKDLADNIEKHLNEK